VQFAKNGLLVGHANNSVADNSFPASS